MKRFIYGKSVPAVRKDRESWRCPWCGEDTWIVSIGDGPRDPCCLEMYCDNPECDSRETAVLIVRGYSYRDSAGERPDVQALQGVTYEQWKEWHTRGRRLPSPDPAERTVFNVRSLASYKDPDDLWPTPVKAKPVRTGR